MDKKGEVSSTQIVGIVLGITAFVIVLLFFNVFKNSGDLNEESCKLSILTRATSPEAVQNYIPLKCETKKLCITNGKGECSESFAGEDIEKAEAKKNTAKLIEEKTAEEFYKCWNMFGQGKYDLFGSYAKSRALTIGAKPYCVICSRIGIDKNIDKAEIDNADVYKYLKENNVPGTGLSYLESLTDQQFKSYPEVHTRLFKERIENKISDSGITISSSGREIAIVFMQIKSKNIGDVLANLGSDALLAAGGSFLTPGVRGIAPKVLGLRSTGVIGLGVVIGGAAHSAINAYSGQVMAAGYCGKLATNAKDSGEGGCSMIEAVPYDFKTINELCEVIEGVP